MAGSSFFAGNGTNDVPFFIFACKTELYILITRKGEKDGKKWQFKGCSNYPKCDYKEWGSGKKSK